MRVATIQCFNYSGQEFEGKKKDFPVCDADTPVILKQGQGHQTNVLTGRPKQSYNHAKFEKSSLKSVHEKGNI